MKEKPFLSVVIPAYNEEKRLPQTLEKISSFLMQQSYLSEIIIVDDGSQDKTSNISLPHFHPPLLEVRMLQHHHNQGKGAAVKTGILKAKGKYILFTDADNSTPISEVNKLLPYLITSSEQEISQVAPTNNHSHYEIAIGSRHLQPQLVQIQQPFFRRALSRFANRIIQFLLLPGIVDTQCGFKLFFAPAARRIFSQSRIKGWGFDLEILFLAQKMKYRIKEVPVIWLHSPYSRVRPLKAAIKTFAELLQIHLNNYRGYYSQ